MADDKAPLQPTNTPQNKTEHALTSIHRANKVISISTVVALVLIVAMLGFALIQLQRVNDRQQQEIKAAADRNNQLVQELKNSSERQLGAIADYLECIAKTNPTTRTNAEVDACLDLLRKGGKVSYFLGHPKHHSLTA